MDEIVDYFVGQIVDASKSLGMKLSTVDLEVKDLKLDFYLVFEISYFGHSTGFFRLAISNKHFSQYNKFLANGNIDLTLSMFNELLNTAISATVNQFESFEHTTIGMPRSFQSPIYEPQIEVVERTILDESLEMNMSVFLHHDQRKTDLSVQLEESQIETRQIMDQATKIARDNQSQQSQKFEALGQLAAGVAHEINTPVQYLNDNLSFIQQSFSDILENIEDLSQIDKSYYLKEIPSALKDSKEGILRIAKIVSSLKEFSHPGNNDIQLYDAKYLIDNCLSLTKNEWKYLADVSCEIMSDKKILIYPSELSQVLVNMIVNSSHSIKEKYNGEKEGLITIRFYEQEEIFSFEVEDNGSGVKDEIVEKIYDPFFTTKQVGIGTGQGLAISKLIIENKHNGNIKITKNSSEGLCFKIDLGRKIE